ncbi:MAG: PP0621 family protein [Acidobacteriota bacterium]|nr:PP0621 family protein [Acidobacteriota bacterium]
MIVRFLQILVAFVVVRILWGLIRALFATPARPPRAGPAGETEERGRVVACQRCDLHVLEERAVARDGRTFCSDACAASASSN